ncbi:50S ribosomal protein L21 [bacterium CPR1]|nr:50S ribosomal protein L21 [bacterium CPR1]
MYAVVETGGKQYRVTAGQTVRVEKLLGEPGSSISLEKILSGGAGSDTRVGDPYLAGARVEAEILAQDKGRKVTVFKYKKRKRYRIKNGHRQPYTALRIKSINL